MSARCTQRFLVAVPVTPVPRLSAVRGVRACCGPVFPVADPLRHIQMPLRMCQFHRSVSGPICAGFGKADNPA